jgi:endonuclease YncB( thermonuclease family)
MPVLIVLLAALAAVLAGPAPAHAARTGRCLPGAGGPTCHFWTGRVTEVNDGDTVDVDLDGDGTKRSYTVRFAGVQAMELRVHSRKPSRWRGPCQAVQAANAVNALIRRSHRRVRLSAQRPSTRYDHRLGRTIAVRSGGRWVDLGETLLARGLVLWMPDDAETAWNDTYNHRAQEAAQRHVGLWNPAACRTGPSQDLPLRLWVRWDPPGVDSLDFNGEWVKIHNPNDRPVPLAHWWVRDSMLRRFTFPAGTVVGPGRTVTLFVGPGASGGETFHWGLHVTIFENTGDGAYLFDPDGDLRASMVYPCVVSCTDPAQGAFTVTAQPRGAENVRVRNLSDRPIDLYGYALAKKSYSYAFGPGSIVQPGETMVVDVGGDPAADTRLRRHWGLSSTILRDRGDAIALETFSEIVLACDAWGSASC